MSFLKKKGPISPKKVAKEVAKEVIAKCDIHKQHQRNCVDCEKQ